MTGQPDGRQRGGAGPDPVPPGPRDGQALAELPWLPRQGSRYHVDLPVGMGVLNSAAWWVNQLIPYAHDGV